MSDDRIQSIEERLLVLRDKNAREHLNVSDDVLDYIATKFERPAALKGALVQVFTYAAVKRRPVDLAFARSVLGTREEQLLAAAQAEEEAETTAESVPVAEAEPEAPPAWDTEPAALPAEEPPFLAEEQTYEPVPEFAAEAAPVVPGPEPVDVVEPEFVDAGRPEADEGRLFGVAPSVRTIEPAAPTVEPEPERATVWFAPVRTTAKRSLVTRAGQLLDRAGLRDAVADGDSVAVKMHFGEQGNTGFVQPMYVREVVARIKAAGGRPFLTDANTLYRGQRANAVDHIACAVRNGFSYATIEAPVIIADGIDGRDAVEVPVPGCRHFETVRIGSAAVHADAMVVVTHFKGHEATGFGGALKNVGMGLGCRSAKQRMHSDFRPEVTAEKCTACGRCVKWCPVEAIVIGPDRVAEVDYEICYGCGECVASCPEAAIATQWKTTPEAIQEKIVEHALGAVSGKQGKVVYVTFVMNVSPDCDCWHFSDASIVPDIGVLASSDIVAIEQAALDLVASAAGLEGTLGEGLPEGGDKFETMTGIDGTHALDYAEALGLGTRSYALETIE